MRTSITIIGTLAAATAMGFSDAPSAGQGLGLPAPRGPVSLVRRGSFEAGLGTSSSQQPAAEGAGQGKSGLVSQLQERLADSTRKYDEAEAAYDMLTRSPMRHFQSRRIKRLRKLLGMHEEELSKLRQLTQDIKRAWARQESSVTPQQLKAEATATYHKLQAVEELEQENFPKGDKFKGNKAD